MIKTPGQKIGQDTSVCKKRLIAFREVWVLVKFHSLTMRSSPTVTNNSLQEKNKRVNESKKTYILWRTTDSNNEATQNALNALGINVSVMSRGMSGMWRHVGGIWRPGKCDSLEIKVLDY